MDHRAILKDVLRNLCLIPLVGVVYYTAGKLGLLLSVPPGFATAVWPASGIALAAVLYFGYGAAAGVFLGSFFLNDYTASSQLTALSAALLAATIASGAAFQVLLSAWLIRRITRLPTPIEMVRDILAILLLGGVLGCLVNASISTFALNYVGLVPATNAAYTWLTWWVGDVVGVAVFTPILILLSAPFSMVSLARKAMLTAILCVVFSANVYIFAVARDADTEKRRAGFDRIVAETGSTVERSLDEYIDVLAYTESLFSASTEVTAQDFDLFSKNIFARQPGLQALMWNPRVEDTDRAAFEAYMHRQGFADFAIREWDENEKLRVSGRRPFYYPIAFMAPESVDPAVRGTDANASTDRNAGIRRQVMEDTRLSGESRLTPRMELHTLEGGYGFILCHAVMGPVAGQPQGYLAAVVSIVSIMDPSLAYIQQANLRLRVTDVTAGGPHEFLYDSATPDHKDVGNVPRPSSRAMQATSFVEVAGRRWELDFYETPERIMNTRNWTLWLVLAGGMAFTSILSAFLLLVSGRTQVVQRLVEQKTREIATSRNNLENANTELKQAQDKQQELVNSLMKSNTELERFAYVASHNMQEPLRMVSSFSELLNHEYATKLDDDGKQYLKLVTDSASRMQVMIADLLEYARIGSQPSARGVVDSNLEIRHVLENLATTITEHKAVVTHDDLPQIQGSAVQFMSLLQNLIDNAIKYQPAGAVAKVHVSVKDKGDAWEFAVADNGIGMDKADLEAIFEPFKRLHTWQQYPGTGIGLAVCKKIVESHNGRIWAEAQTEQGSTFRFTWPRMGEQAHE